MANVQVANMPQARRVPRRPQHTFQLRHRPWEIQPFMLAPVLPGETMNNLLLQARVVTDPIKNPLIGWWCEHYVFYVKHRDLAERDELVQMALDPSWTPANIDDTSSSLVYYHGGETGSINWAKLCLIRVVEEYFRDADEAWNIVTNADSGLPVAKAMTNSVYDSLISATAFPTGTVETTASDLVLPEFEAAYQQWQFMRANSLTNMDYEDFLATYGVRKSSVELHRPELVRFTRNWSYPSNTVEPSTGIPSSAVSWAVAERADKDRFFKEPGFLFGCTVVRPKVYMSNQNSAVASYLNNAFSWLPAIMADSVYTSLRQFAADAGPIADSGTDGYWIDIRDLFLYGDQYVNFALTETDAGLVALPTTALNHKYVSSPDALFVTATTKEFIRQDGIVSLNISGTQRDFT